MSYRSVFRPDLFSGQSLIVTGGGSGIGRCIAHELAALGGHVVLVGRQAQKLDAVAAEIRQDGGSAACQVCDIRDEERVRSTVHSVVAERGRIHGLVNNAGGQFPALLADTSKKGFEAVVRNNLVGGFVFSREVFRQSMRESGGAIVNIVADFWRGMPLMGHTGAARAGMVNFTRTAAVEWAPSGVRVNAVAPGWIASSGLDAYEDDMRELFLSLPKAVPLKRLGSEAEVSAAVCFLLSEAASFITGATLQVDGGAPLFTHFWPSPDHDRSTPFDGFHRATTPKVLK